MATDAGISSRHPIVMDHDSAIGNVTGNSGKQALVVKVDNINIEANGSYGALSVTGTPTLACANGLTNKTSRFALILRPLLGSVYWGFTNSVSSTTGMPILSGETATLQVNDSVTIYVVSDSTADLRVVEV